MRSASILVAALAVGAGSMLMARDAHALGPVDLEVGAKVGVGSSPVDVPSDVPAGASVPNPLGLGIGGRAGVSFLGIYGGVNLMYYLGGSEDVAGQTEKVHTFMYGIEAGYGITLIDILTIRPQVGIGNATFSSTTTIAGSDVSASNSNLYIEPGVTGLVSLAGWFVGADANLLFFPGLDNSKMAVTLHGQIGIKL